MSSRAAEPYDLNNPFDVLRANRDGYFKAGPDAAAALDRAFGEAKPVTETTAQAELRERFGRQLDAYLAYSRTLPPEEPERYDALMAIRAGAVDALMEVVAEERVEGAREYLGKYPQMRRIIDDPCDHCASAEHRQKAAREVPR